MKPIYLEVKAEVRYWEDALVNGTIDNEGVLMPCKVEKLWCPVIRLSDGLILRWPEGTTAIVHYKICDPGKYWLLDDQLQRVANWRGNYVPIEFLSQGINGDSDYIVLSIGPDGHIQNWEIPSITMNEWSINHGL